MSQRLGHASVGFTLTVYSHALPGYDREAADAMAALILGEVSDDGWNKSSEGGCGIDDLRRSRP